MQYVRWSYPYICTCVEDADTLVSWVGISDEHAAYYDALDHCSEGGWDYQVQLEFGAEMDMLWNADTIDYDAVAALIMSESDADEDGNLTAEEFANTLFYTFDVTPNANEQAFVESMLADVCASFDASGDGLSSAELISCLQTSGQDVWDGTQAWKESRAGAYDPQVWYTALASSDTDGNGVITVAEGIAALESYLSFTIPANLQTEFENSLDTLCTQYDGDTTEGLNESELTECLTNHGQWIWEELSFFKAASANM